jgi:preprotein translocase subunit SecE
VSESPAEAAGHVEGATAGTGKRRNLFARIALFVRQVVAELRKVVTPTRSELLNYTWVVIVFVAVAMVFITIIDYIVGRGTLALFG